MKSILAKAFIITSTLLAFHNHAYADALIDDLKDAKFRLYGNDITDGSQDRNYRAMQKHVSTRLIGKWIELSEFLVNKENVDWKCTEEYFDFKRIDEYSFSKKSKRSGKEETYILQGDAMYNVRRDYQQALKDMERLKKDVPDLDKTTNELFLRYLNMERILLMISENTFIETSNSGRVSLYGRCP